MRVSVIVATYNSAPTLRRALDSILEQSIVPEVLVVDGASTDETMAIVASYGTRIHWSVSEPDAGVYDAWNKAVVVATGEWIVFLGSDDWIIDADGLEKALAAADALGSSVGLIYGRVVVTGAAGEVVREDNGACKDFAAAARRSMPFTHTGTLHRRSLFERIGNFDTSFRIIGDYDFVIRALACMTAEYCGSYKVAMGDGGMSNSLGNRCRLLAEMQAIRRKHRFPWRARVDGYIALKKACYGLLAR